MVYKSRSSTKPTFGYTFLSHKSSIILSVSSRSKPTFGYIFLSHKSAKGAHYAGFLQAAISEPCLSFHHPTNTKWSGCLVDCIKQPKRQLHAFAKPQGKARTSILSQRYGPQSYYIIYGTGSIGASSSQSSRCRCGPVAMPLLPTVPICVPAQTSSPAAVCASAKHA